MSSALSDHYCRILLAELRDGRDMAEALRDVTLAHAEHLRALGTVGVLALEPCPRCGGTVLASDEPDGEARCASGCSWSYRRHGIPA